MGRKKKISGRCYYCGGSATSREHVPPRAFFPEAKDLPPGSPNYRAGLVTVPSCSRHNSNYSKDDETAAYLTLLWYGSNGLSVHQFTTKAMRAFLRNPKLSKRVIKRIGPRVIVDGKETAFTSVNIDAAHRVMEKIGRAIYFDHFGEPFLGRVRSLSHGLLLHDLRPDPLALHTATLDGEFEHEERHGAHHEIFHYQLRSLKDGKYGVRLCFYEGIVFFVLLAPEKDQPATRQVLPGA